MAPLIFRPLPGVGFLRRLQVFLRGVLSRRMLWRLAGVPTVILEGRVIALRPVPLGIARRLVPAIIRCARSFSVWEINEALYDDFVIVLSLGLRLPARVIEQLDVPLWQLAPVIEHIGVVNGLPKVEAGGADLGKLAALMTSTGTNSSPTSSAPPAGPGSMSSNA